MELANVRQTLQLIKLGLSSTKTLLEAIQNDDLIPDDKFGIVIGPWIHAAQRKYEDLDVSFKSSEENFGKICKLFGEDPKNIQPGDFFGVIYQFVVAFKSAQTENIQYIQRQLDFEKKERERQVSFFSVYQWFTSLL